MIDTTRTQWFCCSTEKPVRNGHYEFRAKLEHRDFYESWPGVNTEEGVVAEFVDGWWHDGKASSKSGWMGSYEWRGLAVKP